MTDQLIIFITEKKKKKKKKNINIMKDNLENEKRRIEEQKKLDILSEDIKVSIGIIFKINNIH